jgi:hypothetical protein
MVDCDVRFKNCESARCPDTGRCSCASNYLCAAKADSETRRNQERNETGRRATDDADDGTTRNAKPAKSLEEVTIP